MDNQKPTNPSYWRRTEKTSFVRNQIDSYSSEGTSSGTNFPREAWQKPSGSNMQFYHRNQEKKPDGNQDKNFVQWIEKRNKEVLQNYLQQVVVQIAGNMSSPVNSPVLHGQEKVNYNSFDDSRKRSIDNIGSDDNTLEAGPKRRFDNESYPGQGFSKRQESVESPNYFNPHQNLVERPNNSYRDDAGTSFSNRGSNNANRSENITFQNCPNIPDYTANRDQFNERSATFDEDSQATNSGKKNIVQKTQFGNPENSFRPQFKNYDPQFERRPYKNYDSQVERRPQYKNYDSQFEKRPQFKNYDSQFEKRPQFKNYDSQFEKKPQFNNYDSQFEKRPQFKNYDSQFEKRPQFKNYDSQFEKRPQFKNYDSQFEKRPQFKNYDSQFERRPQFGNFRSGKEYSERFSESNNCIDQDRSLEKHQFEEFGPTLNKGKFQTSDYSLNRSQLNDTYTRPFEPRSFNSDRRFDRRFNVERSQFVHRKTFNPYKFERTDRTCVKTQSANSSNGQRSSDFSHGEQKGKNSMTDAVQKLTMPISSDSSSKFLPQSISETNNSENKIDKSKSVSPPTAGISKCESSSENLKLVHDTTSETNKGQNNTDPVKSLSDAELSKVLFRRKLLSKAILKRTRYTYKCNLKRAFGNHAFEWVYDKELILVVHTKTELSLEQWDIIITNFINLIDAEKPVKFHSIRRFAEVMHVICVDQECKDWLLANIPQLNTKYGYDLQVMEASKWRTRYKLLGSLSVPKNKTPPSVHDLLKGMELVNQRINTKTWEVLKFQKGYRTLNYNLFVEVDEESLFAIIMLGWKVRFDPNQRNIRLARIRFKFLDDKMEEDSEDE